MRRRASCPVPATASVMSCFLGKSTWWTPRKTSKTSLAPVTPRKLQKGSSKCGSTSRTSCCRSERWRWWQPSGSRRSTCGACGHALPALTLSECGHTARVCVFMCACPWCCAHVESCTVSSAMGDVSYTEFFEFLDEPRTPFTDTLYDKIIERAGGQTLTFGTGVVLCRCCRRAALTPASLPYLRRRLCVRVWHLLHVRQGRNFADSV